MSFCNTNIIWLPRAPSLGRRAALQGAPSWTCLLLNHVLTAGRHVVPGAAPCVAGPGPCCSHGAKPALMSHRVCLFDRGTHVK